MSQDDQTIRGAKRLILDSCEQVMVSNSKDVHVVGCLDVASHNNTIRALVGNQITLTRHDPTRFDPAAQFHVGLEVEWPEDKPQLEGERIVFREWNTDEDLNLLSTYYGTAWGREMEGFRHGDHRNAGIHAFYEPPEGDAYADGTHSVVGAIAVSGKVMLGPTGVRAQKARIVLLAYMNPREKALVEAVANHYGVGYCAHEDLKRLSLEHGQLVPDEEKPERFQSGGLITSNPQTLHLPPPMHISPGVGWVSPNAAYPIQSGVRMLTPTGHFYADRQRIDQLALAIALILGLGAVVFALLGFVLKVDMHSTGDYIGVSILTAFAALGSAGFLYLALER